ncbi:hypothetical protein B0T10DRAFT_485389 [Thelonectria olida]|uniref:Uncharacterized protein n=1 Tax=Thelonectria olida TaxID=1576542 RepID=A0A9P9ATU8_9HYPO|nr:hypothetical protein B0T10DRAFT_485389 [Thelonectria olida]
MPRPDPANIVTALRQTESARTRSTAIRLLGKALRRGDRFQPAWEAVGGADGVASLMAEFSVRDVRSMCRWLGRTASAVKARPERRAGLGELVRLLYDEPRDERPFRDFYQNIVPACNPEVVQEWEDQRGIRWTAWEQKRLFLGHRGLNERKFLDDIFSPSVEHLDFKTERLLFRGNLALCGDILSTLAAREGPVRIPGDFMTEFAMPLLKRLLKTRFDDETRNRFLRLVIQCLDKHPRALATQLHLRQGGLVQYAIQRWIDAPVDSVEQAKTYMIQLIGLLPTNEQPPSLSAIHDAILTPTRLGPDARYELLRLLLRHMKGYNLDIEDESEAGLARLSHLPVETDLWPAKLFFSVDNHNAMQLFERLASLHPRGDFLSPTTHGYAKTVLRQARSMDEWNRGDSEVVRALLIKQSQSQGEDRTWLERVCTLVHERRKKAQESREPQARAFWTKSALNLCVAAGDLDTFKDTVLWARRFNKDALAVMAIYNADVFETTELEALFGAIPEGDTMAAATTTPDSMVKDIGLANRIMIDLVDTAAMIAQTPGVLRSTWNMLLRLPKVVVDWRLKNADSYNKIVESARSGDPDLQIAEAVWKPTIDTLVEVEALLRKPTSEALGSSNRVETSGVYVLQKLPASTASMLAELAGFVLERMRTRLGAERVRARMGDVVQVVIRVARSDQPWLACPFVRDLVIDGDDNSSWHRQLLNVGFLSSLPAKAARTLLYTMADAMKDKMREQNSRPRDSGDSGPQSSSQPRPPAIKVTTVKMMAQLLQDNVFIDAPSSCDILVGLLAEARHIDAQTTLVNSLMSAMEEPTCPQQLQTRILDALEMYIVPVAAQLSERRALTEDDWKMAAAQDEAKLPDVSEENPLLSMLVGRAHSAKLSPEVKMRLATLIGDILEQSAANNGRWMNLFLEKNQLALDYETLPTGPAGLRMVVSFFRGWTSYMPASLLRVLLAIVSANISPTPPISRVTEAVKARSDLVNSNAGKHWLAQYDNPGPAAFRLGLEDAALALQRPAEDLQSKLEEGRGITVHTLREFVLTAARQLASTGDIHTLESLVLKLSQERFRGRENWESWRSNCIPLIHDIAATVQGIRHRDADISGPPSRPLLLLNTFRLQVKALPMPYSSSKSLTGPEETKAFILGLSELVDRLAKRQLPYHDDFAHLKAEVLKAPITADFARFALELHKKSAATELVLADYLRLDLAGGFLVKASDPMDEQVVRDARDLVDGWEMSRSPGVRTMGFSIAERLRAQGKRSWFSKTAPSQG